NPILMANSCGTFVAICLIFLLELPSHMRMIVMAACAGSVVAVTAWLLSRSARNSPTSSIRFARLTVPSSRAVGILLPIALILSYLYVPDAERVVRLANLDLMHHWDFYAISPMWSYFSGKPLIIWAYSQYGVGWPML